MVIQLENTHDLWYTLVLNFRVCMALWVGLILADADVRNKLLKFIL